MVLNACTQTHTHSRINKCMCNFKSCNTSIYCYKKQRTFFNLKIKKYVFIDFIYIHKYLFDIFIIKLFALSRYKNLKSSLTNSSKWNSCLYYWKQDVLFWSCVHSINYIVKYYTRKFTGTTRTLTNHHMMAGGRLCSLHQAHYPIG